MPQPSLSGVVPFQFTREQYYRMGELGWFNDKRVELLEGVVVEWPPLLNVQALAITLACEALCTAFGKDFWVRTQMPLDLTPHCTVAPDAAVVPGAPRSHKGKDNPTSALLVVEVSDSTLEFNRNFMSSLYASAGIAEYWIINLADRALEVRRRPGPSSRAHHAIDYTDRSLLQPPDTVAPISAPLSRIVVADLLP